jgi:hypothetical protein
MFKASAFVQFFSSIVVSISACHLYNSQEAGVRFPAGEIFFLHFCCLWSAFSTLSRTPQATGYRFWTMDLYIPCGSGCTGWKRRRSIDVHPLFSFPLPYAHVSPCFGRLMQLSQTYPASTIWLTMSKEWHVSHLEAALTQHHNEPTLTSHSPPTRPYAAQSFC